MKKNKWSDSTLIGQIFGRLTVVALQSKSENNSAGRIWKCKCICGNECYVDTSKLKNGNTKSCGCIKTPNLIGKKFGKLTVIKSEGIRKNNVTWLCQCECGGIKIVPGYQLKAGSVKSCGCLRSGCLKGGIRSLGPGVAVMNKIISTYKGNAEITNRIWELTTEQCKELFSGKCHYCGDSPKRTYVNKRTGDSFTYNGIDRKNNDLGYTAENSVSCCTTCNLRKGSSSAEEFIDWANKIAINHSKK